MNDISVFVGTPMFGGQCTAGFASSLLNLQKYIPFAHSFISNESLITRARNMLAHSFLKSEATHLLFIDADVAFDAEDVAQMIKDCWDCVVVGGLYPKKMIDW